MEKVIRPALADRAVVLCDRFSDSTLAYQGGGHSEDRESLRYLIDYATGGLVPDWTIYFDIAPDIGLYRKVGQGSDRIEDMPFSFHNRVSQEYRRLIAGDPGRWIVIDAEQSICDVHRDVISRMGYA